MPKRKDINRVLLIGAGPIVIGQACEFDYSGSQACNALREEGLEVVLLNSNPATIMTDPAMAHATYIAPITPEYTEQIIVAEKCDAILPTMGGQTALNISMTLHQKGVLDRLNIKLLGASIDAIKVAEDRESFRQLMGKIGLKVAKAEHASSLAEAYKALETIGGLPAVIRSSFTLGGLGGGIAHTTEQFEDICQRGLSLSPTSSLLIEESLAGWKEFELEVIRDRADNCIVVCGIENIDPLGVHTGDSITVAPIQTLTDKEYQLMRNAAFLIMREIGVDTGGSNVQFAVNPVDGRMLIIEMNPRVSRSSALASKATGFPIAKVATKLALGYTLDELRNEITGNATPASFEPTLDYVVVKVPRFDFAKFPNTPNKLDTQMRSVGEAMAIGRTFPEALQKAYCSLETGLSGLEPQVDSAEVAIKQLHDPKPETLLLIADALRHGVPAAELNQRTGYDNWFIGEIAWIVELENQLTGKQLSELDSTTLRKYKREGFSDRRLAQLLACDEDSVRDYRATHNLHPVYKRVDSCAAEFATTTAYMYSTYEDECEAEPTNRDKIIILGSGPNRIGQGIEFDYCCIHASLALRENGFETIMINCNPETVSTDYGVSDRLFFEPLTTEHVLEIIKLENPKGIIVQYGGQTPLTIAHKLEKAGAPIIGTTVASIDSCENRAEFRSILAKCKLSQPVNGVTYSVTEGKTLGKKLGMPLVVRPSYVLGGQAMEIIYSDDELSHYLQKQSKATLQGGILLDKFLADATEVDIDAICDGTDCIIAGVLEHIERAGIHSGDSACSLPPHSLSEEIIAELKHQACLLAKTTGVIGLLNVQFAVQNDKIYVLEVNPRASRTIPFISKATGYAAAKIGALVMAGHKLAQLPDASEIKPHGWHIKEAVFPFDRMPGADTILGPEMRSTGEVMGIGNSFASAFIRATEATNNRIPTEGVVLLSVRDSDKSKAVSIARQLQSYGFTIAATHGTAEALKAAKVEVTQLAKVVQGKANVIDLIKNGKVTIVINTISGKAQAISDSGKFRAAALQARVLYFTTIQSAAAAADGIGELQDQSHYQLLPLQQWHLTGEKK